MSRRQVLPAEPTRQVQQAEAAVRQLHRGLRLLLRGVRVPRRGGGTQSPRVDVLHQRHPARPDGKGRQWLLGQDLQRFHQEKVCFLVGCFSMPGIPRVSWKLLGFSEIYWFLRNFPEFSKSKLQFSGEKPALLWVKSGLVSSFPDMAASLLETITGTCRTFTRRQARKLWSVSSPNTMQRYEFHTVQ